MLGLNTHDNIDGELEKIFQNNDCSREASNNRRHKVRQKMLLAMLPTKLLAMLLAMMAVHE